MNHHDNQARQPDAPPTTAHRDAFVEMGMGALQRSLARVGAAENLASEHERVQAWHLLSYVLNVDAAWPLVRDLLLALAPQMEQTGQREDWLRYLERGVARSRELDDVPGEAGLCLYLGNLYWLISDFPTAAEWLGASAERFENCGDAHGQARALNRWAYVAYLQQQYDVANERIRSALALLAEDDLERAMCDFVLGMIAIDHENWQTAEAYHRKTLELRQLHGDRRGIAISLQNIGYAVRGQGKLTEAVEYFESALAMIAEIGDPFNEAIMQMNLGCVYLNDKPQQALEIFIDSEDKFNNLHNELFAAKVYTNKGLAYLALHDWKNAEQSFLYSIELYKEVGNAGLRLNSVDGLGMTYIASGEHGKAVQVLEDALAELDYIGDVPNYNYLFESLNKHLHEAKRKRGATNV